MLKTKNIVELWKIFIMQVNKDFFFFLVSSLSNLVNNLAKGIHKVKCKYGHDDKKCETCGIKYKAC